MSDAIMKKQAGSGSKFAARPHIIKYNFWQYIIGHFRFFHRDENEMFNVIELLNKWRDEKDGS